MKTLATIAAVVGALALVAGDTVPASEAAFPGINGRIAFMSRRTGNGDIYSVYANGTGLTQLTDGSHFEGDPAWSPAGAKIAFLTDRDANDNEIYVMNADGTGQMRLTFSEGLDTNPAWSPDGTKIAFDSMRDGNTEIYVMNADGSDPVNLTNSPENDSQAAWSPDGTKIAFNRGGDVWVMDAGGGNPTNLTNSPDFDGSADWSPGGAKMAFISDRDGPDNVYTMNADGTAPERLTSDSDYAANPAWSPDGTKIVFDWASDTVESDLFVINADGSGRVQLTNHVEDDFDASWQAVTTLTGDMNCDDEVDAVDALVVLRHVAGLPFTVADCDPPGTPGPDEIDKGDLNCNDAVDAVDALRILRFVAGLPNNPVVDCPEIGT